MQQIRITIENLGPIEHIELDLPKYLVLIGKQGSGKTLSARVIHKMCGLDLVIGKFFSVQVLNPKFVSIKPADFLGNLRLAINEYLREIGSFDTGFIQIKLLNNETIGYSFSNEEVKISSKLAAWITQTQTELLKETEIFTKNGNTSLNLSWREISDVYLQNRLGELYETMFGWRIEYYIPAARYLYLLLKSNSYLIDDPVIKELIRIKDEAPKNHKVPAKATKYQKEFLLQATTLLGGSYNRSEFEESVKIDGTSVPVNMLSSGQKEMLVIINTLIGLLNRKTNEISLVAEEPESNLFPASVSEMVKLLIMFTNQPDRDNRIIITTHSPYVLTTLNNLLYAGRLNEIGSVKKKELNKAMSPYFYIKPSEFQCFKIEGGRLVSLVEDLGNGMLRVNPDYIDEISNVLGDETDKLIELDPTDYSETEA